MLVDERRLGFDGRLAAKGNKLRQATRLPRTPQAEVAGLDLGFSRTICQFSHAAKVTQAR